MSVTNSLGLLLVDLEDAEKELALAKQDVATKAATVARLSVRVRDELGKLPQGSVASTSRKGYMLSGHQGVVIARPIVNARDVPVAGEEEDAEPEAAHAATDADPEPVTSAPAASFSSLRKPLTPAKSDGDAVYVGDPMYEGFSTKVAEALILSAPDAPDLR